MSRLPRKNGLSIIVVRVISAHLRGCFERIRSRFVGYSPLSILPVRRECVVYGGVFFGWKLQAGSCFFATSSPSLFGKMLTCFVNNSRGESRCSIDRYQGQSFRDCFAFATFCVDRSSSMLQFVCSRDLSKEMTRMKL